jgi:hypothetical protein
VSGCPAINPQPLSSFFVFLPQLLFSCRTEFRVLVNLARWASGSVVMGTTTIDPHDSLTDPLGALSHIPRGPGPARGRPEAHLARLRRLGKPSGRTEKQPIWQD